MALSSNSTIRTAVSAPWPARQHMLGSADWILQTVAGACVNATDFTSFTQTVHTKILDLPLIFLGPTVASFTAWILLALAASYRVLPYNGRGHPPCIRDRLRFALKPAITMLAIQNSLMMVQAETVVGISYDVKMTGTQEYREKWPEWRLATGCWVLAVGVGLAVVGILSMVFNAGIWREEMKDWKRREKHLPPLCP